MDQQDGIDRILHAEFIQWLSTMMNEHPDFTGVQMEVPQPDSEMHDGLQALRAWPHADMAFYYRDSPALVEVKTTAPLTAERVQTAIQQLSEHRPGTPDDVSLVFIVPEAVQDAYRKAFERAAIMLWDSTRLAEMFQNQLQLIWGTPLYRILIRTTPVAPIADTLTKRLAGIPEGRGKAAGQAAWSKFERLCADIFGYLFVPPLSKPILERKDFFGVSRRDIILANFADDGFWLFMQQEYRAHYMVIDANKESHEIGENEVLQLANYLRDFGDGAFGIFCCRTTPGAGAIASRREQWVAHRKLILFLTDDDLIQMLTLKKNDQEPEQVIRQKVEDFGPGM